MVPAGVVVLIEYQEFQLTSHQPVMTTKAPLSVVTLSHVFGGKKYSEYEETRIWIWDRNLLWYAATVHKYCLHPATNSNTSRTFKFQRLFANNHIVKTTMSPDPAWPHTTNHVLF
jgi:hypothetical protein